MSDEVGCLGGAGAGAGAGEVVATSDQAGGCGAVVVLGKFGVDVGCSLSGLSGSVCQCCEGEGL